MRAFPLIRSLRGAVVATVLTALPLLLFSSSALAGLYGTWLLILAAPPLIMLAGLWGGLLPLAVGLLAALAQPFVALGQQSALLMALYLIPFTGTFIVVISRQVPFFKAGLALCLVYLLSAFGVLYVLQRAADGRLYLTLGERIAFMLTNSPSGDQLLVLLYQNGLLSLDPSLLLRAQGVLGGLSALGRQELTSSLVHTLADLFSQTPGMIVTGSILLGFCGLGLSLYIGRRAMEKKTYGDLRRQQLMRAVERQQQAVREGDASARLELESYDAFLARMEKDPNAAPLDYPDLGMPPFSEWYLPRRCGLMAAVPAIGLLMAVMGTSLIERTIGSMLGSVFLTVYTLQGVAAFDFMQKKAGRTLAGRWAFTLVLVFLFRLFRFVFVILGVIDQVLNFRHLRPAPQNDD